MKRNNIYKSVAAFALVGMLTGCSSSYLDIDPTTSVTEDKTFSSAEGTRLAVGGLVESMNKQYSSAEWFGSTCGEAFIGNALNDVMSPDYLSGLFGTWADYANWSIMSEDRSYSACLGWTYYYTLISEANNILDNVDIENADEDEVNALQFYRAQALTFRAHAYQKLLSLYGPRFEDSKDGAEKAVILRLHHNYENLPLATYKEVVDQIYADLDEALALYTETGLDRDSKTNVNADVAHGIYSRIAMMNHDWKLAQEHAAAARKSYTVMDADTYLSGFTEDCSDYIWHCSDSYDTTYYWSWGARNACNGAYNMYWTYGAGAINLDLYRQTDPNDIRRKLYITPDKITSLNKLQNVGGVTEADFWDPEAVNNTGLFVDLASGSAYDSKTNNGKAAAMYTATAWLCYNYVAKDFKGNLDLYKNDDSFYNYQYHAVKQTNKNTEVFVSKGVYVSNGTIPLGSQMKFWALQPYGNMAYPWMRASEMCLTEAEAYYMMGDEANAKKCLTELMKKRVEGYTCNTSGDDLLEEIRVNRRMELFMEGQGLTDFKRWNVSVERRAWVAGDPTSGNALRNQVMPLTAPSACNGWRWTVPYTETDYNQLAK
jgi:hypothetical protein